MVSQVGVSYAAYAGLRLGTGPWVLEEHIDMACGSHKSGGVSARVGGLRARLVWERAARGAFAACAVERRARAWVSGWDQGFGCWEFVDMA